MAMGVAMLSLSEDKHLLSISSYFSGYFLATNLLHHYRIIVNDGLDALKHQGTVVLWLFWAKS